MTDRPQTLLLYAMPGETAATVGHYIEALGTIAGFDTRSLNLSWRLPESLDLDRFDVILIHYSLMAGEDAVSGPALLTPRSIARVAASRALKAVFLQDEHRNIRNTVAVLRALDAGVVFTTMPPQFIGAVYPESALPGVRMVNVLTGYVDPSFLAHPAPAYAERPVDVGYRGRRIAYWLGRLPQEKAWIAERFLSEAEMYGLTCDISLREEDRLYGAAWPDFLGRCKAVLGTESGASIVDLDGSLRAAVDAALNKDPSLMFEAVHARFLAAHEGRFSMAQISARCFEAAALKTLMILHEGRYSDRLTPWRHYVPLKKDHSNIGEVVAVLRDESRWREIVERAYAEVALAPENGYGALQAEVANGLLAQRPALARESAVSAPYTDDQWAAVEAENGRIGARARRYRDLNRRLRAVGSRIVPPALWESFAQRVARPARTLILGR